MLYISKESQEYVKFRCKLESMIFFEKNQFLSFSPFFSKGGNLWCCGAKFLFSQFFKILKNNLKNGFNGTYKMLKGTKS